MGDPRWRAVPAPVGTPNADLWRFIVAPQWVAAVPAETHTAVLRALLRLRDAGEATLEQVIAVLPLQGPRGVDNFAAAELRPATTVNGSGGASVIVRGESAVDVFGESSANRLEGRGIRPWLLSDFRDVIALSFTTAGARAITAAELPPPGASASVDGDGQWAEQGGAQQSKTLFGIRLDLVLGVPGDTAPLTNLPLTHAPQPHHVRVADAEFVLDVDSYIGRRPNAARIAQNSVRLVTVSSPAHEVSATHVLLRQSGNDVEVTDLESTNGTLVELPDGSQLRLHAHVATVVPSGSRVLIGDGVVIDLFAPGD